MEHADSASPLDGCVMRLTRLQKAIVGTWNSAWVISMKLIDREPTQEMIAAGREALNLAKRISADEIPLVFSYMYDAAPEVKQEPVEYQFQGKNGFWYRFDDTRYYINTVKDGSWPIRALYALPPDAQVEIAKRDERIASLIAAGTEYQRQFFEQSDQIKELSEDRDTWKARTEFSFQQRDALAAQNQQLIDMIKQIIGHLNLYHLFSCVSGDSYDPECADLNIDKVRAIAHKALALPDLTSPVLNRVKAEALRDAADEFDAQGEWKGHGQQLRNMAAAIEKGEGL